MLDNPWPAMFQSSSLIAASLTPYATPPSTQGIDSDLEAISTIPQYHGPARDAIAAACRYFGS